MDEFLKTNNLPKQNQKKWNIYRDQLLAIKLKQ